MLKDAKTYWTLFTSTFMLSAFTFGGGYVIVPLMRKRFVEELQWIDETEMLDLIAIAQSSPGAMAVNTSILIGYRTAGLLGSLVTLLGTITPPLIILTIISQFYVAFRENVVVAAVLKSMQAGVAAVIADVVFGMAANVAKQKSIVSWIVMISAFVAIYFFKINVMYIILACIILGILMSVLQKGDSKGVESK